MKARWSIALALVAVALALAGCGDDTVNLSDVDGAFHAHGVECQTETHQSRTELISLGRETSDDGSASGRAFLDAMQTLPDDGREFELVACDKSFMVTSNEKVHVVLLADESIRPDLEETGVKIIGKQEVHGN